MRVFSSVVDRDYGPWFGSGSQLIVLIRGDSSGNPFRRLMGACERVRGKETGAGTKVEAHVHECFA
jgi:hypothetical protein